MSIGLLGFQSVQERQGGAWEYVSPSRLGCRIELPPRLPPALPGRHQDADQLQSVS